MPPCGSVETANRYISLAAAGTVTLSSTCIALIYRTACGNSFGCARHVTLFAHLLPIDDGRQFAVLSTEGTLVCHVYDTVRGWWDVEALRMLTVRRGSVAALCPTCGVEMMFGGESGGAEEDDSNDMVLLDEATVHFFVWIEAPKQLPK